MNKWVLLQPGEHPPALNPEQFIYLAMAQGGILRVMYRFISNIKGNIAGYRVDDNQTPPATLLQNLSPAELPYWVKLRQHLRAKPARYSSNVNLH
ncbi:hypothetical protein [Rheinheimera maricola]|uniref:WYL domain-containing protein n=1 Tax=Rheinheimera maricola TaxID=2793282 RepID=A0ABS7XAH8_9GAMM|nr:hypothetical protein [Rheinheimera maricola]MBZ9612563.1 hypothetical protein [Rheinheimera maricola]